MPQQVRSSITAQHGKFLYTNDNNCEGCIASVELSRLAARAVRPRSGSERRATVLRSSGGSHEAGTADVGARVSTIQWNASSPASKAEWRTLARAGSASGRLQRPFARVRLAADGRGDELPRSESAKHEKRNGMCRGGACVSRDTHASPFHMVVFPARTSPAERSKVLSCACTDCLSAARAVHESRRAARPTRTNLAKCVLDARHARDEVPHGLHQTEVHTHERTYFFHCFFRPTFTRASV